MTPIYGHINPETAYVVDDYPYGYRLRCKIRYWLEYKPNHGYRFVSQTTNPKKGNIWNKPKASTYAFLSGCMYLDENNHVQWCGVGLYSTLDELKNFVKKFPESDLKLVNKYIERLEKANG